MGLGEVRAGAQGDYGTEFQRGHLAGQAHDGTVLSEGPLECLPDSSE